MSSPPPAQPSPPSAPAPAPTPTDRWLALALLVCTALVFWPIMRWVVGEVTAREQIRQVFIILAAAAGLVAWQHRQELRVRYDFGNRGIAFLGAGYLGVAAAWATGWSLLVIPAFALSLAGSLHVLFGAEAWRFLRPLIAGFVACLLTVLLFPLLDWPLRQLAGINAAHLLRGLNLTPQLGVILQPEPRLLLSTGRQVFEVATECNGFGLITTSAVLALLAAGIAGRRATIVLALIPVAMAVGFILNLLRILVICLLAPYLPNHYHLMHEIVGTLALWIALGLVAWLAWRPAQPDAAGPAAAPA